MCDREGNLCQVENLSGRTPRPIAVARNGSRVASMKPHSAESARAYAAPLPMTTSGLRSSPDTCIYLSGGIMQDLHFSPYLGRRVLIRVVAKLAG